MAGLLEGTGELKQALRACAPALVGVALLSSLVNVLMLTGSVFMLEVYDRVLPSRSVPTLVVLAVVVMMLYAFQGLFDAIRSRVLVRIGAAIHERLAGRAFRATLAMPLSAGAGSEVVQPLRELDTIRGFLSGQGPSALADLPWMPIYLGVCFLFHPAIGWTATAGAVLLVGLTALTEFASREPSGESAAEGARQQALADAARRNAEAARAMGLAPRLEARWRAAHGRHVAAGGRAADVVGGIGAASKVLRMVLQSAVLGVGAWLVIQGQATGGIMIASSILTSRALAPVELAVANWRGFVAARRSAGRLRDVLAAAPPERERLALPKPSWGLALEGVSIAPPGASRLVVQDIGFELAAGDGLAIVGPSGSGKSSLARAIVGVWQPARGKVRLDGAALAQWPPELLGSSVGYIPQTVELFAGSVTDNIRRFDPDGSDAEVIAAARTAGAHELILRLPEGYATEIGEGGSQLSAGQRQRVALARALYRDPFLVVLDEPNSNLDAEGEAALTEALRSVRRRGGIAVVIAHRPSALAALDTVLVMAEGRAQAFGPKDRVLGAARAAPPAAVPPELKVVAEREGRA